MSAARYPDTTETRAIATAELRAGQGRTLAGYAAVFDQVARIGGTFDEVIRRTAFDSSLAPGNDVWLLSQHDWSNPLARRTTGSLQLHADSRGLRFEAQLPDTRAADDVLALARAGTVGGCSIGFRVRDGGDRFPRRDFRELIDVELVEVSVVTVPAYSGTSISARAMARATGYAEADNRIRRLRLLEL